MNVRGKNSFGHLKIPGVKNFGDGGRGGGKN